MAENKINKEELKSLGQKLENKVVSDEELESISGGFTETTPGLLTRGMSIRCPKCNTDKSGNFDPRAWQDKKLGSVEYHCNCGCKFICYDGYVIMKDDWMTLCGKKKINYRYANI